MCEWIHKIKCLLARRASNLIENGWGQKGCVNSSFKKHWSLCVWWPHCNCALHSSFEFVETPIQFRTNPYHPWWMAAFGILTFLSLEASYLGIIVVLVSDTNSWHMRASGDITKNLISCFADRTEYDALNPIKSVLNLHSPWATQMNKSVLRNSSTSQYFCMVRWLITNN